MNLGMQSQAAVETALKTATAKLSAEGGEGIITDIHLQPCQSTGELVIFDDEDHELARAEVKDWLDYEPEIFYGEAEKHLRTAIEHAQKQKLFDTLPLLKPYSFVLVDEERETIADLLLVDDDTMLLNDELLKGLDEELDAFLKKLLEE